MLAIVILVGGSTIKTADEKESFIGFCFVMFIVFFLIWFLITSDPHRSRLESWWDLVGDAVLDFDETWQGDGHVAISRKRWGSEMQIYVSFEYREQVVDYLMQIGLLYPEWQVYKEFGWPYDKTSPEDYIWVRPTALWNLLGPFTDQKDTEAIMKNLWGSIEYEPEKHFPNRPKDEKRKELDKKRIEDAREKKARMEYCDTNSIIMKVDVAAASGTDCLISMVGTTDDDD